MYLIEKLKLQNSFHCIGININVYEAEILKKNSVISLIISLMMVGLLLLTTVSSGMAAGVGYLGSGDDPQGEITPEHRQLRNRPEAAPTEHDRYFSSSLNTDESTHDDTSAAPTSIMGYHNLSEVENKLFNIANSNPSIAKVFDLSKMYPHPNSTPKRTIQNRSVWALKVSDNPGINESEEPEVVYMGMHHSREWISVEVVLFVIDYIINNFQTNTTLNNIIKNNELWFVPVVNPDGFHYSQYGRDDINNSNGNQWRKNMNESNGSPGFQDKDWARGDGVDPNRNYGYKWGYDNQGSSPNAEDVTYRGTAPFSEPCTQLMRDLCEARNFTLAITFHSHGKLILYPWGYTNQPTPHGSLFNEIAREMSKYNGYTCQQGYQLYPSNGDTTDWLYGNRGCLAYTLELGTQFIPLTSQIIPICQKNLEPSLLIAKLAGDPYEICKSGIRGKVINTQGEPLEGVNISTSYAGDDFTAVTNSTGHYRLKLPVDTYVLVAEKDGYWPTSKTDIALIQNIFVVQDLVMVDSMPPVISNVWVNTTTSANAIETVAIGSTVRVNVAEKNDEAGLNGTVNISSISTDHSSGALNLTFDLVNDHYYYLWDTSSLIPGTDYIFEAKLEDFDSNIDPNGSNDGGPDLVLTLVDHTAPIVSLVDTRQLSIEPDTDEHYEIGNTIRILVYEQLAEKWLNGTVRIISNNAGYDSGIQELVYNETLNHYYWDWSSVNLTPSDDYGIETTLRDSIDNVDIDGLASSPDLTVTLVDTTPPKITRVNSLVDTDSDEVYETGSEVVILIEVEEFENGLSGYVKISSVSNMYSTTYTTLAYNSTGDHFFVLWNTRGLEVSDDYEVEAAMADKYLNYDQNGSNANGPDLMITLQDTTPPEVADVYSFVGTDRDGRYELNSSIWLVVVETNHECNLTGLMTVYSPSQEYFSGVQNLAFDPTLDGYYWVWNTSGLAPADYWVESTLTDGLGNKDLDGLPPNPDIIVTLEDKTPPEVSSVWSYSKVGSDSDQDNIYETGSVVQIIIEERFSEPGLSGTISITSENTGYDPGEQNLEWDEKNNYYFYTWPTEGLVPSNDYNIETTLIDIWLNIDHDGLPRSPDLIITLEDTIPPDQVTNLKAVQNPQQFTMVNLTWNTSETDVFVLIYRSDKPILNFTGLGLSLIANVTLNNLTDILPSNPGNYYYLVLVKDRWGNIDTTVTSKNTVSVILQEPDRDPKPIDKGKTATPLWIIILIIVVCVILVVLGVVFYLRKRHRKSKTSPSSPPSVSSASIEPEEHMGEPKDEEYMKWD